MDGMFYVLIDGWMHGWMDGYMYGREDINNTISAVSNHRLGLFHFGIAGHSINVTIIRMSANAQWILQGLKLLNAIDRFILAKLRLM